MTSSRGSEGDPIPAPAAVDVAGSWVQPAAGAGCRGSDSVDLAMLVGRRCWRVRFAFGCGTIRDQRLGVMQQPLSLCRSELGEELDHGAKIVDGHRGESTPAPITPATILVAWRGRLMRHATLTRLRLSRLRRPRWRLRLAHDERAPLRSLRATGLRQPLPAHPRPPDPADVGLATTGAADGRGLRSHSTAGPAPAGIASHTRSSPASSRPTIRCRSSSGANRYPASPASSARAVTRARD